MPLHTTLLLEARAHASNRREVQSGIPFSRLIHFQTRETAMTWAAEEFAGAQLGDARLNHRLIKLTERFADKPTASIPGACPDWSETQGAYRFFDQANNAKRPLKWE
ncbi:transposase, partial [Verminephrobacter eiseniae]|nr:transposase [Verminephrobacter eiseniae]